MPFEDYTAESQGHVFHELVQYFMQQAIHTHQRQNSSLLTLSEHLDLPLFSTDAQDGLAASLSSLDTFAAGGILWSSVDSKSVSK